jgi:hypothetical protein
VGVVHGQAPHSPALARGTRARQRRGASARFDGTFSIVPASGVEGRERGEVSGDKRATELLTPLARPWTARHRQDAPTGAPASGVEAAVFVQPTGHQHFVAPSRPAWSALLAAVSIAGTGAHRRERRSSTSSMPFTADRLGRHEATGLTMYRSSRSAPTLPHDAGRRRSSHRPHPHDRRRVTVRRWCRPLRSPIARFCDQAGSRPIGSASKRE